MMKNQVRVLRKIANVDSYYNPVRIGSPEAEAAFAHDRHYQKQAHKMEGWYFSSMNFSFVCDENSVKMLWINREDEDYNEKREIAERLRATAFGRNINPATDQPLYPNYSLVD